MRPFIACEGRACPLPFANIDTDQLIPARFMRRPRREGYGPFLLHDLRRRAEKLDPDFPLNAPEYLGAQILVARRNFGCGSSREAAVYALADAGFRCVAAPSFGEIFASNAVKNGVLPARIEEEAAERLLEAVKADPQAPCRVDLAAQTIVVGETVEAFVIDPVWKQQLLMGWDEIDLTLAEALAIAAFRARDEVARPWAAPRRAPSPACGRGSG